MKRFNCGAMWLCVVAGGLLACLSSIPQVVTTVHTARIRAYRSGLWVFSPWISYCVGLGWSPPPPAHWPPHPLHHLHCGHPAPRAVKAQFSLENRTSRLGPNCRLSRLKCIDWVIVGVSSLHIRIKKFTLQLFGKILKGNSTDFTNQLQLLPIL